MEARRAQPAMLQGLSRFLIEHEPHGQGFDIAHPAGVGSGRMAITCRGCGATHEYATTTIEFSREVEISATAAAASPASPAAAKTSSPPPAPAATAAAAAGTEPLTVPGRPAIPRGPHRVPLPGPGAKASGPAQAPRKARSGAGSERRFRPVVLLIPLALILLAFGIARLVSGDDESEPPSGAPTPPTTTAEPATPGSQEPPAGAPTTTTPSEPGNPPGSQPQGTQTRTYSTGSFVIEAPASWERSPSDLGLLLVPESSDASLEVFSDDAGTSLQKLALDVTPLVTEQAGTSSAKPSKTEFQGNPAVNLSATSAKREVTGIATIANEKRYFILSDVEEGASEQVRSELDDIIDGIELR